MTTYKIDMQYATKGLYLLYSDTIDGNTRNIVKVEEFTTIEEAEQALCLAENLLN